MKDLVWILVYLGILFGIVYFYNEQPGYFVPQDSGIEFSQFEIEL